MGKTGLAFDQINSKQEIVELSVVLYADSFFYGLWTEEGRLAKAGYHPYVSLSNVMMIINYNYELKATKILSTLKPYVHLPSAEYEPEHFETYFQGLYPLDGLQHHRQVVDQFKCYDISTLHYLDENKIAKLADHDYLLGHISTAMSNYAFAEGRGLVCYLVNDTLHISLRNEKGYLLYNQFDCRCDMDGLYYMMLIFEKFDLDPHTEVVNLAGAFNHSSDLKPLLSGYIKELNVLDLRNIGARQDMQSDYYDLHICRACVS